MQYVWDRTKNRMNLARHGLALEKVDERFDYGETRVYAIGVANGLEVTVIYTDVSRTERRIISAWRAERHERTAYWQSLG
jgi:uncharacterized protein